MGQLNGEQQKADESLNTYLPPGKYIFVTYLSCCNHCYNNSSTWYTAPFVTFMCKSLARFAMTIRKSKKTQLMLAKRTFVLINKSYYVFSFSQEPCTHLGNLDEYESDKASNGFSLWICEISLLYIIWFTPYMKWFEYQTISHYEIKSRNMNLN